MERRESKTPLAAPSQRRSTRQLLTISGWNKLRLSLLRHQSFQPRPWLVSLVLHAVLLMALACLVIDRQGHLGDGSIWAKFDEDGEDRITLETEFPTLEIAVNLDEVKIDPASEPVVNLKPDRSANVELRPELALHRASVLEGGTPLKAASDEKPEKVAAKSKKGKGHGTKDWFSEGARTMTAGRTVAMKKILLRQFGGTPKTEDAVNKGLEWLLKQQEDDGGWYFSGPYANGMVHTENRVSATAMALLAFLGAGHTHQQGDYQRPVNAGLHWLVAQQNAETGYFGEGTSGDHPFYTHAQATLVVSEAFAMTQDKWLMPSAQSALQFAVQAQGWQGGWRYRFQSQSDTSVTGWVTMSLVSGKAAGLVVPEETFNGVRNWLNEVSHDEDETYSYRANEPPTPSMTASGLLCRMYLGWRRTHPAINGGTARLLEIAPFRIEDRSYYYWYYATQVMHHAGGPAWGAWNNVMREQLPAAQVSAGPEAGSWVPLGDINDRIAGRLYSTCMAIYCLEVYYRHMPIYESPWSELPPDP